MTISEGDQGIAQKKHETGAAFGRALAHFRLEGLETPHGLYFAEEKLLASARNGEICRIHEVRPETASESNKIRAGLIRFLALGGDTEAPVHEKGVQLTGAFIEQYLDLESCDKVRPLHLLNCWLDGSVWLRDASTRMINLGGSRVTGIEGDRVRVNGNVLLNAGFEAVGQVRFADANVSGQFNCSGGRFSNRGSSVLFCDDIKVHSNVMLTSGFASEGEVRFPGANIGGQFTCNGGRFCNPGGTALGCSSATVGSDVLLLDGFEADGEVRFSGANISGQFACNGGRLCNGGGTALRCSRAKIGGDVSLINGFEAEGQVRFPGANIAGEFSGAGGRFCNEGGKALSCSGAKIGGAVLLSDGFEAVGEVRFPSAVIGGQFTCDGGRFCNVNGIALFCDRAKFSGNVLLDKGFEANGEVRFSGADIAGHFFCAGGRFVNRWRAPQSEDNANETPICAKALNLSSAVIRATLWLGPAAPPNDGHVQIEGSLDLRDTHAKVLTDHQGSWPVKTITGPEGEILPCHINLDGFSYGGFAGKSSVTVLERKAWLHRQPPQDLGKDFKPQPFEQLARVYRDMGHDKDAREIRLLKEKNRLRRPWRVRGGARYLNWRFNPLNWLRWLFLEVAVGYGCRAHRPIIAALILWIATSAIYSKAARDGAIAPANPVVYLNERLLVRCRTNWSACDNQIMKDEHTPFYPWFYSLDVLLPIVPLGQEAAWAPVDAESWALDLPLIGSFPILIGIMWFEILFGWAVGLILVAVVSGAIQRQD